MRQTKELLALNPGWQFSLLAAYWNENAAMAISNTLPHGDPKVGQPMVFVWTLQKYNGNWLLTDIDLEELKGLQLENSRFVKAHPEANIWFNDPDPNSIPARQETSEGKDHSVRLLEMGRMRTVLGAVHLYAKDHNEPPKTLANLRNYLNDPNINTDDFIYKRPQNLGAMHKAVVPMIVQRSQDEPNGLIVGFSDGHVKYVNDPNHIKQLGLSDPNSLPAGRSD